ncbi:hypothetical protein [Niveibacterium microcysteis]|uniref:Uncharacterized protein n=1 Tax=Niveibacterium microcysteis TaxID=2811415 RepID=A0ABX7MA82_9RHOO|nr:hypothetical protein [Niveibacterium microcysteis]QSI78627.1 hypothetical protein JY500_08490 [Niveibacterium microcysteis]
MEMHADIPDEDDVLVWPDGFWCFRAENSAEFLRSNDFREVRCGTAEWKLWVHRNKDAVTPYQGSSHL